MSHVQFEALFYADPQASIYEGRDPLGGGFLCVLNVSYPGAGWTVSGCGDSVESARRDLWVQLSDLTHPDED